MQRDMKVVRWLMYFIVLVLVVYFAVETLLKQRGVNYQLEEINAQMTLNEQIRDSLIKEVQNIKPTNINEVKNIYNIKYENEAAIIRNNDVSADIVYFAEWYNYVKGY